MKQNPKDKPPTNNYLKYSGMAFQMGAVITLGVFGGIKTDAWLQLKTPIFTLVFSLLGVGIGIYLAIKDFLKK